MLIKKIFLVLSFLTVSVIALIYGISPKWFAKTFLGIADLDLNIAHILRAVTTLYLALGLFWLFSAFNIKYRNTAVLTVGLFSGGLVTGRVLSFFVDGQPQPLLVLYIVMEFVLVPVSYWVFKLPEEK